MTADSLPAADGSLPTALSPSGAVLYGSGVSQLAATPLSPAVIGTFFGQSLYWSNNSPAATGAGASLNIPNFFTDGRALVSPSAGIFGKDMIAAELPQLVDVTGNWGSTIDGNGVQHDSGGSKIIAVDGSINDTFDKQSDGPTKPSFTPTIR